MDKRRGKGGVDLQGALQWSDRSRDRLARLRAHVKERVAQPVPRLDVVGVSLHEAAKQRDRLEVAVHVGELPTADQQAVALRQARAVALGGGEVAGHLRGAEPPKPAVGLGEAVVGDGEGRVRLDGSRKRCLSVGELQATKRLLALQVGAQRRDRRRRHRRDANLRQAVALPDPAQKLQRQPVHQRRHLVLAPLHGG